ncbi:MAG: AAA family ATPase [Rhodoferax sp.]
MKITTIKTCNVLGARAVDVRLARSVSLFAGRNGAGKSSLQEAVRMALTGEAVRVGLKKEYGHLVTEDQESGFVEVTTAGTTYSVVLPSGKGIHCDGAALPFVLDAQRFARLDDKDRRAFLFGLMGLRTDGGAVKDRLLARGCDAKKVEQIVPILRAGFDAAQKEAAAKARDAKASWKTATGGETWGKDKAAKWQPAPLPTDATRATSLRENAMAQAAEYETLLGAAQQELGAATAAVQKRQQLVAQRATLEEQSGRMERIKAKLARDEAEVAEWGQRVAATREKAGSAPVNPKAPGEFLLRGLASVTDDFLSVARSFPDPFDESLINRAETHLAEYKKLHGWPHKKGDAPDPEAVAKLPEYERALALVQSAVANDKRDLATAEQAAARLKELDEQAAEVINLEPLQAKVAEQTAKRNAWRADADKYRAMAEQATQRQAVIDQATALHADVLAWTDIADALAPDGIPGEMLGEALGPINKRMQHSAAVAEWAPVAIRADMRITYGERDYALISESEKWRVDAMIAEAVSHLAGVRLLVLDRFDVLDLKGREDLLYWLDGMAQDGEFDTALVFGTLKALPAHLPEAVEAHWIENGVAGQLKEAA